jgi:hypothetical protein
MAFARRTFAVTSAMKPLSPSFSSRSIGGIGLIALYVLVALGASSHFSRFRDLLADGGLVALVVRAVLGEFVL